VVKVYPLHRDNKPSLPVEHSVVPILLKESPKMLVGAPFLGQVVASFLTERDYVPWINLVVVDHFSVGVSYQGAYLQTLKLFGRVGSGTTRWGVLGEDSSRRMSGRALLASLG
jgi:hypothetical protein